MAKRLNCTHHATDFKPPEAWRWYIDDRNHIQIEILDTGAPKQGRPPPKFETEVPRDALYWIQQGESDV